MILQILFTKIEKYQLRASATLALTLALVGSGRATLGPTGPGPALGQCTATNSQDATIVHEYTTLMANKRRKQWESKPLIVEGCPPSELLIVPQLSTFLRSLPKNLYWLDTPLPHQENGNLLFGTLRHLLMLSNALGGFFYLHLLSKNSKSSYK